MSGLPQTSPHAPLHRQRITRFVQLTLHERELGQERLQVRLRLVKQNHPQRADDLTCIVVQRKTAHHKGARPVGQQVNQDRFTGLQHLQHLRVLNDRGHGLSDKLGFAGKTQRRQIPAVLVIDPNHTA